MNRRPIAAALTLLIAAVAPLSSRAAVEAVPRLAPAADVRVLNLSVLPVQTAAVGQLLERLPSVPTPDAIAAMPADVRSQLATASLLADPKFAAMEPRLEPAARSVQEALRRRPELAVPLAEIRRQLLFGRLDEAALALNQVYDRDAARPALDAGSAVAAPSSPVGPFHGPALAPSRPVWAEGVFLPKTVAAPLPGDALGVTVHRLANGLTVYLSPSKQEPRVSFEIVARAGSRHDPLEATGMAHYLEHMQFKGTARLGTMDYAKEKAHLDRIERLYDRHFDTKDPERRAKIYAEIDAESQAAAKYAAPNEFDKIYGSAGFTQVNAHTNYEETSYQGSFPSNKADLWARVETDRLTDPVYRIFLPELEAVYEEYNASLDDPQDAFFRAAFAALFKGHPYGREILGLGEHLKNPSISRMRKFFREHYRPNNMAVILSGDFDRREMLARIESTFGKLPPEAVPAPPAGKTSKLAGVERVEIPFQAEEAVQVDWLLPPHNDPDEDALVLAGKIFNSMLNLRVNKAQRTKWAGASQMILNESGAWFVIAQPKDGQTPEQAERVLMDEVARFKAGDFTDADLQTAVTTLEIERKKALQENGDRVASIRRTYVNGQEWAAAAGALERLKGLTKDDVLRAANRYLGEDRVVVYRRKGASSVEKVAKPSFTPVAIDSSKQSSFFKELSAMPARPLAPHFLKRGRDYETVDRPWGRLYAAKNPVNDLFHLEFKFDRGNAQEKRLDLALSLMRVSGAGGMTAEELQRTLDRLGSTIEAACREQECTVQITGLEKNLEETLRLALLRFEKPNVAPGAFRDMLELERGSRADRKLDQDQIHSALSEFASRGKDSEFLKELTPAQLAALTEKELEDVLGAVFGYRRDVLYTGARDARQAAEILSKAQPRRRFKKAPKRAAVKLLKPARSRVIFVHKEGMNQALIGAYAADGRYDAGARLDYNLYNAVMDGGMGGIYFQEVRESRALAYTAQGGYAVAQRPQDDNKVLSYSGTQADKAVQTAKLMEELMSRPPITPERYALARRQIEESYRTEAPHLEDIPLRARTWEKLGYKSDPRRGSFRSLSSYSSAKLAEFTRRFRSAPLTLYVVGDRARVDLEGLKKLGDFEERSVDELFPF